MQFPRPITYVTREIERALGMPPSDMYRIVAGKTPYGETIAAAHPKNVLLVDDPTLGKTLGTRELIEHPAARDFLSAQPSDIIVFKNTARVEEAATRSHLHIINPRAELSETVENKMSQIEWLGELGKKYLPKHVVMSTKNLAWTGEAFIIQWAHGHTGGGTVLVSSEEELKSLQQKFPYRLTRRTPFIQGPSFTVNAVVTADRVLVGNISYQITGLSPFTESAFSTVGNDWALTRIVLDQNEIEYIETMVRDIGKKLNISGWRGLFGVDIIKDSVRGTISLIEINARQPASTTFESILQEEQRSHGAHGLTTFEAHLMALLGEKVDGDLIPIVDGAQIIQRVTGIKKSVPSGTAPSLEKAGYTSISYPNSSTNEDLIRIQSRHGIMGAHGQFNDRGTEIVRILQA